MKKNIISASLLLCLFASCNSNSADKTRDKRDTVHVSKAPVKKEISALEKQCIAAGLVDVHLTDTTIAVDMKYSTKDNFMGCDLYGDFDKAYLQKDVAGKLVNAQKFLRKIKPGYSFVIYDATRPRSVQQKMWDTIKMPFYEKIKFLSNPQYGSLHNFGAAVDLSILNEKGDTLDMGAPFDFNGNLAAPVYETLMQQQGKLTQQHIDNRKLLREAMGKAGFFNIQTEWWHFNSCTFEAARVKYKIIE